MNIDAPALKDHIEKQNHFVEVINAEKLLWALIHSKGLLHTDVQDLYRKARAGYENIIVNDHEIELQDVEYCLWKLHYKHIDEYRKRIRQSSGNLQNSIDSHMEGFKSFLSEATEFYKDLIAKIKICCGLPEEPLYKKDGHSFSVESTKLHKFQYAHHRFLVCLGDLARYRELCKKTDIQNHKWSAAATYYLKATMVWPDSGNPQNQLALLATYVGDDFLALYHCVRSLAVKEPFPDAWDNLMLLFEKNRLSHLHSLSSEAQFDFLKPSERSSSNDNKLEGTEHVSSGKSDLWPLFVRMISFFYLKSSLEDFPCAFSSTMREFEVLLALDDTKLKAMLESYEHLDSARRGPYRALQLVSILIFIIHSLSESPELKDPKEKNDIHQFDLTQLAWIATFICMGRLVEKCLKGNHPSCYPFLGAVLVFVEWLVDMLDKAETCSDDERVSSAISYFFGAFGDFLNRIDIKQGEVEPLDRTALWEDYELRGFSPIANAHISLNFSTHWESLEDYDSKYLSRAHRILFAAMKFVENSSDSRKWISYDKSRRKFYAGESIKNQYEHECGAAKEYPNDVPCAKGESVVVEEEEVILFKPITRYNSVPLQTSATTNDEMSIIEGTRDQTGPSDECVRRATSLRCNKPFKQQETLLKDSATYPAGPPSLSAWVLDREHPNMGREKGTRDFCKLELSPIEEIASASLSGLSVNDSKHSLMDISSPYVAPLPSAPLLPDDAAWFRGNSSGSSDCIKEADGILGASPVRGYSHWPANPGPLDFTPGIPGFIDGYPPLHGMSSSEWLYQYTNNHNLERANNHIWPVHFNPPGNFYGHDGSRFDFFDRWGNPLISNRMVYLEGPQLESPVYGADEQRREKLFLDYQRLNPYGCGAGTELRAEQPPLLQYLKEREWQLERESQLRGPPYMGN